MLTKLCIYLFVIGKCYAYQSGWNSHQHRNSIPQDIMRDVVNDLALKMLAIHNEDNDNNIALSPYGALSVLVALAEGVQGNAAAEIHRAVQIPPDMYIVRIGLRDIHRHLKSYFIPDEGFLSGLSLSHDNVTLRPEYEDILKFYGFDIDTFNNAMTTTKDLISTTPITITTSGPVDQATEITSTRDAAIDATTALAESTTEPVKRTIKPGTSTTELEERATDGKTTINYLFTTGPQDIVRSTTEAEDFHTYMTESTTLTTEDTTKPIERSTEAMTSVNYIETTTTTPIDTTTIGTERSAETNETGTRDTPELTFSNETTTVTPVSTVETAKLQTSSIEASINTTETETSLDSLDAAKANYTVRKNTRSILDYIIARYYDHHSVTQRPPPYVSESNLYFLVDGKYEESNINYMTYDTVLPFHYIPHLTASALRFPLDSNKYYLLLLLPEDPQQINKLICDLRLSTNLKYIVNNLRLTHVKAVIPSFMLKGYTVLTSTFQKMGIREVFEPRHADFTPMTSDKGIYVTNVEQAITVNIRNYMDPASNNGILHGNEPVPFKADHPFLYFVVDAEIGVTLMAGKITNPLNSRIR